MSEKSSDSVSTAGLSALLGSFEGLSVELEKVGLTNYEARCYLGAIALGGGRAEEIAELARVPRTSAYKALDSLTARGFMEQSEDRPMRFIPVDPLSLLGRLRGDLETTFERIAGVQEAFGTRGIPQVVYTLNGKDRVLSKIGEMIERAKKRIIISSPNISVIRKHHGKSFERALERGVEVLVIAPPFVKLPKCTQAVRRNLQIATDLVMDGEEALIASADLTACGFTDNALLAIHVEGFLEIVMSENWERAE
jgi:HTH-type transcriptional regulator, sugar sensing transcriptional regulator